MGSFFAASLRMVALMTAATVHMAAAPSQAAVAYIHLRAHETLALTSSAVCR
ncbi:hypothetical protein PJL18_04351 [Paenarthrobacter nicotinovorans]|nr:hypothetical protein [Paenarthrobacter nicotinovorans]